jgi:hypothetical protein
MDDRSNERPLFIAPDGVTAILSPDRKLIWFRIGKPHPSLGFDPNIALAMELSPQEARSIAQLLLEKAREAEGGSSLS